MYWVFYVMFTIATEWRQEVRKKLETWWVTALLAATMGLRGDGRLENFRLAIEQWNLAS